MNLIAKEILIIISIFFITLWLQNTDDQKYNNKRISFYDKYKLPIFFSASIGLILNIYDILCNNILYAPNKLDNINNIYDQEIYIDILHPYLK